MCNKYESQVEEQAAPQRGVFRHVSLKRGSNMVGLRPSALLGRTALADLEDGVATLREHLPRPAGKIVGATETRVTVLLDPDPLETLRAEHNSLRAALKSSRIEARTLEHELTAALSREKTLQAKLHGWVLPPAESQPCVLELQAEVTRLRLTAARAFSDGQEEAKKQIRRVLGVLDKI